MKERRSSSPRPWEVWWANLDPARGHEQRGRRPVIVVGSALACSLPSGLVVVIPTTTTSFSVPYRVEVSLDPERTSYAMCEQIKSISADAFSALKSYKGDAGLTLMTCKDNGTNRLLVRCEQKAAAS